jgi:hypothetical protein
MFVIPGRVQTKKYLFVYSAVATEFKFEFIHKDHILYCSNAKKYCTLSFYLIVFMISVFVQRPEFQSA